MSGADLEGSERFLPHSPASKEKKEDADTKGRYVTVTVTEDENEDEDIQTRDVMEFLSLKEVDETAVWTISNLVTKQTPLDSPCCLHVKDHFNISSRCVKVESTSNESPLHNEMLDETMLRHCGVHSWPRWAVYYTQ